LSINAESQANLEALLLELSLKALAVLAARLNSADGTCELTSGELLEIVKLATPLKVRVELTGKDRGPIEHLIRLARETSEKPAALQAAAVTELPRKSPSLRPKPAASRARGVVRRAQATA
jgi:hypothetical protein